MYSDSNNMAVNEWINFVAEMILEHFDEMNAIPGINETKDELNDSTYSDNTDEKAA